MSGSRAFPSDVVLYRAPKYVCPTFVRFAWMTIHLMTEYTSVTCIHTYIEHTSVHVYIHTYIHVHITYIHAYIHTYIHTYIQTYIHRCIHTYIHECMHTCI